MSVVSYLKIKPKQPFVKQFQRELEELTGLVGQQKGFIGVEVLHPTSDADAYVILSEWETEEDFKAWEHSSRHQDIMDEYNLRTGQGYSTMRLNRYR